VRCPLAGKVRQEQWGFGATIRADALDLTQQGCLVCRSEFA
jgi:hypothetical protein